jgi:predicted dehydrogenase
MSEEALNHNLHVLCEKPMATDAAAARRLHERAAASDRIVQVGFTNRFSPLVQWLRDAIAEGRLGSPLVFTLGAYDERYDPADTVHLGRMTRFLERAPAFVHEGAHLVDYVAYLTGARATRVYAAGRCTSPSYPSENFVAATVDWDNGDLARLEVGWLFPALPSGHFRVLGPRATVEIVRREARLIFDDGQQREEHALGADWNDVSFDRQLAQFIDSVRGDAEPGPTTLDGLVSLELSEAVVRSMREGSQIDVSGASVGNAGAAR